MTNKKFFKFHLKVEFCFKYVIAFLLGCGLFVDSMTSEKTRGDVSSLGKFLVAHRIVSSFNGRTTDFDSVNGSSILPETANNLTERGFLWIGTK